MATVTGSPGALAPPAGRVHAGQEDVLHPPARSAQLHLAGAIDQSWQQSQQHREVPWLVQHVSGDHPVPGRPGKQRPGLVKYAHGGLQRHYSCRRALCNDANEGDGPSRANLLSRLTCDDGRLAALAGLEPATCCLGDGSAQTLCSSEKWLVSSDRGAKVIGSSDRRELSRYPTKTPSAAIGHVHRTVDVRSERAAPSQASRHQGGRSYGGPYAWHWRTPRRPDGHSQWYG